jgi:hypothetical protein
MSFRSSLLAVVDLQPPKTKTYSNKKVKNGKTCSF